MDRDHQDSRLDSGEQHVEESGSPVHTPWRELPPDLPRSLDDRRGYTVEYGAAATEYYDAWQGQSKILTPPTAAKPPNFNLALNEPDDDAFGPDFGNDDTRVAEMFAAQALATDDESDVEEEEILNHAEWSRDQKVKALQDMLFMAASNGEVARVQRLLRGSASEFIEIDGVDEQGTPPLVYASCFGHKDVVLALLNAGATVDIQDQNQWTGLMWAITNRRKEVARILLDHGASTDARSSAGRTALDFAQQSSEMSEFMQHSGYSIGSAGVGVSDDFYNAGFSQDRLEEELAESEMRRRMMMESAMNLEVDLGNLGLDEAPESPEGADDTPDFVWDRCLNDQMFVFMEHDIERILNVVITEMTPQRSPTQKPVPANIIFLGARYAHYHADQGLLAEWLEAAQDKIYAVVELNQWDMTILAFWLSNATLLLYYLKKDSGLTVETVQFQSQMAELVHEIYILIIRDAERRMDKVLDAAMLDHETIPGFEDITFQNEWNFLKKKSNVKPEPMEKSFRPPDPKKKAQISPRNITSLLSSTLFVLDLYDVHSVVIAQILSQLYYWLGAEIFNRIMSNKRYLARTKAMQIRMNISMLEDWARTNNRHPEHFEGGSMTSTGEATLDAARRHLGPVVQLLQWLQCFSSLDEDRDAMETTLQQLPNLHAKQLQHAVKHYRAEVGEKTLTRPALRHIQEVKSRPKSFNAQGQGGFTKDLPPTPTTPRGQTNGALTPIHPGTPSLDEDDIPESNLMNPALLLPFHLPTSTDMLISYGAGFGGMNKERERRYIPSVPPEFLSKLDPGGRQGIYDHAQFSDNAGSDDGS